MKQRLQKLISMAGLASRRAAEEMILAGRVRVNGVPAAMGQSADPETDRILVDGEPLRISRRRRTIMLHKPRGVLTTMSDDRGRPTVAQLTADAGDRLYPVGRLDMDSEGLLLMTNDGGIANALAHPGHGVDKVYTVFVRGGDIRGRVGLLGRLDELDGEPIRPALVSLVERRGDRAELQMTIHEGKNRQIRRMCARCGLEVTRLIRVAEGPILLGELPVGRWRPLTAEEQRLLRGLTGSAARG